jgi:hypothetical protein
VDELIIPPKNEHGSWIRHKWRPAC